MDLMADKMALSPEVLSRRLWLYEYTVSSGKDITLLRFNPQKSLGTKVRCIDVGAIYREFPCLSWVNRSKALELRKLVLRASSLSDQHLLECIESSLIHSKLRGLDVSFSPLLTDISIASVISTTVSLQSLRVAGCYRITDDALVDIAKASNLQLLDVCGCPLVTDHGLSAVAASCKYLQELICNDCPAVRLESTFLHIIEPAQIVRVTRLCLVRLTHVHASNCILVSKKSINELMLSAPVLEHVSVYGCPLLLNYPKHKAEAKLLDFSPPSLPSSGLKNEPTMNHFAERFATEDEAADTVESWFRRWQNKPPSVQGIIAKQRDFCKARAVQIQKIWRGYSVTPWASVCHRINSLQVVIKLRPSQLRAKVSTLKQRFNSAVRIQSWWRMTTAQFGVRALLELLLHKRSLALVVKESAKVARDRRREHVGVERLGLLREISPIVAMKRVLGAPHGQYALKKQVLHELRQRFLEREEERVRKHRMRYRLEAHWAQLSAIKIQQWARETMQRREEGLIIALQAHVRGMLERGYHLRGGKALARQVVRKVHLLGVMRLRLLKAQALNLEAHTAAKQQLDSSGEELRLAQAKVAIFDTLIMSGRRRISAITRMRQLTKRLQHAHSDVSRETESKTEAATKELERWEKLQTDLSDRVSVLESGENEYAGMEFARALLERIDKSVLVQAELKWSEALLDAVVAPQVDKWRAHLEHLASIAHAPFERCLTLASVLMFRNCKANLLFSRQTMLLKTLYSAKRGGLAHVHLLRRLHEKIQRSRDELITEEKAASAEAEEFMLSVEKAEYVRQAGEQGLRKAGEVQREINSHVWTTQIPIHHLKTSAMLQAEQSLDQRKANASHMTQADRVKAELEEAEHREFEQRVKASRKSTLKGLGLDELTTEERLHMSVLDHQSGNAAISTAIASIACSSRAPSGTFKQVPINLSPILELDADEPQLFFWTQTSSDKSKHVTGIRLAAIAKGESNPAASQVLLGNSGLQLELERGGAEDNAIVDVKVSGSLMEEKLFAELGLKKVAGGPLSNVSTWTNKKAHGGHRLWILRKKHRSASNALENRVALEAKLAEAEQLLADNPRGKSLEKLVNDLREKVQLAKMYAERTGAASGVAKTANYLGLDEKEMKRVLADFKRIDRDGSGSISVDELMDHIGIKRTVFTDKLFRFLDTSGDGGLDFAEFLHSIGTLCMFGREEIRRMCFNIYDVAGKGTVNPKLMHDMLLEMHGEEALNASRQLKALADNILRRDEISFAVYNQLATSSPFMLRPAFTFQDALMSRFFGEAWWKRRRLKYKNIRAGIKKQQNRKSRGFKLPPINLQASKAVSGWLN